MSLIPDNSDFKQLDKLKIASNIDGRWVHSKAFKNNVIEMLEKGISARTQIAKLSAAYFGVEYHIKKIGVEAPDNFYDVLYATLYLDDHAPEVKRYGYDEALQILEAIREKIDDLPDITWTPDHKQYSWNVDVSRLRLVGLINEILEELGDE